MVKASPRRLVQQLFRRPARRRPYRPSNHRFRPKLEVFEDRFLPATVTWTGTANGLWENPANWSNGVGPVVGDDVIINTFVAITLSQDEEIQSLTLRSGTLTGSGSLQVDARLTWTGGTIMGTGELFAEGGILFSGGGVTLGRHLNNDGPAIVTGPNSFLSVSAGGMIDNHDLFEIANNQGIFGTGTFNNRGTGTLRRSTSPAVVAVPLLLNNEGTVDVESGTLNLTGGGTDTGMFTGAPGTTLQFGGGTHSLQSGSHLTVPNVVFSSGTVTINGTYNISQNTTFSGATVTFNAAATVEAVGETWTVTAGTVTFNSSQPLTPLIINFTGGTLTGSENIDGGEMFWSGGSMTGAGTTTIQVVFITGPVTLGRTLTIQFDCRISSASGSLTLNAGAVLNNRSEVDIDNNQGIFGSGTLNTQAGASIYCLARTGTATIQAVFNNSGDVHILSGTLSLSGGGNDTGAYFGEAGTTLQFAGGTHDLQTASTVTVPNVVFSGGSVNISGTYNASDASTFNGATVTFNAPATLTSIGETLTVNGSTVTFNNNQALNPTNLVLTTGTLTGSANVNTQFIDWRGGTMSGTGTTNGDNVEISGSGMTLGRVLNSGGISLEGAASSLTIPVGGILNDTGNFIIDHAQGIFGTGTLNVLNGADLGVIGSATIQCVLNNGGRVLPNLGTLTLSGGGSHSGTFVTAIQGTIEFAAGMNDFQATASISVPSAVFSGGTVNLNGTYNVTDSSTFSGATVTFNPGTNVQAIGDAVVVSGSSVVFSSGTPLTTTTLLLSSGTLTGSDNFTVNGLFTWWGGTMSGTGTTTANGGIAIDGSNMTLARALTNTATATWTGIGDLFATTDGVFNNQADAIFDIQNDQTFSGPSCIPVFNNAGIFRKEDSFGTSTVGLSFNNTGTEDIQTGNVNFACGGSPEHGGDGQARAGSAAVTGVLPASGPSGVLTVGSPAPTGDGAPTASRATIRALPDPFVAALADPAGTTGQRDSGVRSPGTPARPEGGWDALPDFREAFDAEWSIAEGTMTRASTAKAGSQQL